MKAGNHHLVRIIAWADFGFKRLFCIGLLALFCSVGAVEAQCSSLGNVLHHGERVDYDLYFKWGILMPKAGLATLSVEESTYENNPSWLYRLLFRTSGMIEKIYKMRDTLDCHFSKEDARLLFSTKHSDEKDYYLIDDLTFTYHEDQREDTKSIRYRQPFP